MSIFVKTVLTILAIIIATFLIGSLKAIIGYESSAAIESLGIYGLFIGIGLIFGIVAIWNYKPKNRSERKFKGEPPNEYITTHTISNINVSTDSFTEQKKALLNLKNEDVLTNSEYDEKLKILEGREFELIEKQKKEIILIEKQNKKKSIDKGTRRIT